MVTARNAWERIASFGPVDVARLSRRQRQVVTACQRGCSITETAVGLGVAVQTVRVISRDALVRLGREERFGSAEHGRALRPVDFVPCRRCSLRGHVAADCNLRLEMFLVQAEGGDRTMEAMA